MLAGAVTGVGGPEQLGEGPGISLSPRGPRPWLPQASSECRTQDSMSGLGGTQALCTPPVHHPGGHVGGISAL